MHRLAWLFVIACGSSAPPPQRVPPPSPPDAAVVAPAPAPEPVPPVAAKKPHTVASPHGSREDPYYWLRDDTRDDPEVLAYLHAENAYGAAVMAPAKQLEDTLYAELRARVQEDDASVPTFDNGYWYYTRFEAGQQHPIYARKQGVLEAPEEILLDGNILGARHGFYAVGEIAVSRDNRLLAWTDDTVGRRQYVLHVKDLASGKVLPDTLDNIARSVEWANDNKTLFVVGKDTTTLREDKVWRVALGARPEVAFEEKDGSYYVFLEPTKSHRYIEIALEATTNTESRLIDANKPAAAPRVLLPRERDHLYTIDHLDGRFVILTNAGGKNFRLVTVADGKARDRKAWQDVIAHRDDQLIEDFALYRGFVAATVRTGGLSKVLVIAPRQPPYYVDAPEPTYAMNAVDTPDPDAKRVRFEYDSLVAPSSVFELDLATKQRTLLKQQPVPGYDPSLYASEYLHATAPDGIAVPISVVYKRTTPRDGTAPVLIRGYGAYGTSSDPYFVSANVSLLDRGWVYAIAHVRGGQEMGRAWYDDGHLLKKRNTFTDFIAASEYLVSAKYAARDQVFAEGRSAGGLLMGAILNLRPELYRGVLVGVPFVDAVTTMLDTTIPLTSNELDEWGDPTKDKAAYDYILGYSPYDNIRAVAYPAIYVKAGFWDSQVQYYEPAKWVAKLRATKTDHNPLVFDVDMTSGHSGASGRYDALRQRARELAFCELVRARR
jgi:oligopeptidase B